MRGFHTYLHSYKKSSLQDWAEKDLLNIMHSLYTHFFLPFMNRNYSQKTLKEKFQKFDCDQMIHEEQISRLMSLVNVTTMKSGWWRKQPTMCTASSPPLTKTGGHKDSAAALHPTLLQMPLPLLRNLEGGLQISPKALFTTINIGSCY